MSYVLIVIVYYTMEMFGINKERKMLQAVGNYVIVAVPSGEIKTPDGLVLPSEPEGLMSGEVLSAGKEDVVCKKGDVVLFSTYSTEHVIDKDDMKLHILCSQNIVAVEG